MLARIFWTAFLLLFALPTLAETAIARIEIVVADDNPNIADVAGGIQHAVAARWPDLSTHIVRSSDYSAISSRGTLAIGVGDAAMPWLLANSRRFGAAIAYHVNSLDFIKQQTNQRNVTALYRDQPLSRQVALAKLIIPTIHRAALIHSANIEPLAIEKIQQQTAVEIEETMLDMHEDWAKTLSQMMRHNDVLIGIDDPLVYNSNTIRSILLTTYRHGKVLIGPSRPFVNAGSLASCYTTPDYYLQQLLDMISAVAENGRLPKPQYPREFSIAINAQVAASLGLVVPDENKLTEQLHEQFEDCGNGC